MNKRIDNKLDEKIKQELADRGFYDLTWTHDKWTDRIDSVPTVVGIVVFLLGIIYTIYNYPRTFEYLLAHPITEIQYLATMPLYIALGVSLFVVFIIVIYLISLWFKMRNIHKQVYQEYGIDEPDWDI